MRLFLATLAAAGVAAAATPALANEARVEARGGVIWSGGDSKGTAGVAAGYDFDLAPAVFAGGEVSADKVLTSGTDWSYGFTGRLGVHAAPGTKLYVQTGWDTKQCTTCSGQWHSGVGLEQGLGIGNRVYGTVAYDHRFERNGTNSSNALTAGVGVHF